MAHQEHAPRINQETAKDRKRRGNSNDVCKENKNIVTFKPRSVFDRKQAKKAIQQDYLELDLIYDDKYFC